MILSLLHFSFLNLNFSESNPYIFVQEDDLWTIKGHYSQAVLNTDPVSWEASAEGTLSLSILAVRYLYVSNIPSLMDIFKGGFRTN